MPGYVYRGKDRLGAPPRRLVPARAPAPPRAQPVPVAASPEVPAPAATPAAAPAPRPFGLSLRQLEILTLVAEGKRNHEIGAALFLTEDTIKTHLRRAFAALDTFDRAAAAAVALRAKAIHPQLACDLAPVSAREAQVLAAVADGLSNVATGKRLGASPLTVKSHLARISHRWGTGQRAHLAALAIHAGFIP